jgi:hypothetical protein
MAMMNRKQLLTLLSLVSVGWLPLAVSAQVTQESQMGGQGGTALSAVPPVPIQAVDITRNGGYRVIGDDIAMTTGEQSVAFRPEEVERMTIIASPRTLKVSTGVPVMAEQPVAFTTKPAAAAGIDVYYDAILTYDIRHGFGQQTNGTYVPYPQTPDLGVNPQARSISIDYHLDEINQPAS